MSVSVETVGRALSYAIQRAADLLHERAAKHERGIQSMITVQPGACGRPLILLNAYAVNATIVSILIGVLLSSFAADAQGLTAERPIFGSSGGIRSASPPAALDDLENAKARVHRDPYGKPCVDVLGRSRPQTVNTKMFDQTIIAENHCSQAIKLKVCYYGSLSCMPVDVPPYGRKETLLGFFSTMKEFRYQYTEQF
jgi:hypothetical protein